jgi:hypothetical protein
MNMLFLHKLLFPPTKYEHTRGVFISTRLEYDDGTQLWTRIGADLGLAKSFAHRKGERKLKSIVLIGKATPKDNIARAEDVSKFFDSMALASPGTLLCLDELKAIHVNLREVRDAISIESLKRFLTWDCDEIIQAFAKCTSPSLPMETLSWVNTRHINERERPGDAKIALSIFAKLTAIKRLHIHHRSSSYLYGFQDYLHEHLNTEIELASMCHGLESLFPQHVVVPHLG